MNKLFDYYMEMAIGPSAMKMAGFAIELKDKLEKEIDKEIKKSRGAFVNRTIKITKEMFPEKYQEKVEKIKSSNSSYVLEMASLVRDLKKRYKNVGWEKVGVAFEQTGKFGEINISLEK